MSRTEARYRGVGTIVILCTLAVLLGARAVESRTAVTRVTGWAVGIHGCVLQDQCVAPAPYALAVDAGRAGSRWEGDGHLCDLHRSACTGVYSQRESLWSLRFPFVCVTVQSGVDGSTTMFGGGWFSAYDSDGIQRTRWWSFKIRDRGIGTTDEVGMNKYGPVQGGSSPTQDGACGAKNLATKPVIAGDFVFLA